ncbi:carboxypeptidase-like regulatory domain-containing protein [Proteiniphilum sp.]|uniref:carboxypeptidase-like regulatory domain-containing protein n=1 Tax=Proteiniphilum sp. TaxID=1926877 RepID=UPI0033275D6B
MRKDKILKIICLILFLQAFIVIVNSQTIVIKGDIINESDNRGIPNINVFLKNTQIGTISDQNGKFTLNISSKYIDEYLYFTGVSFNGDSILVREIKSPVTIKLSPKTYLLSEVYVMPDSTLYTLLRKAYNKIPINYPNIPTLYEGFYRESVQNEEELQTDFIEAVLSIYKDPYQKSSNSPGQVELLKSRKRKIRDTGILYYGGPYLTIKNDFVLSRADFIKPQSLKNYKFIFNGIKSLEGKDCYDIGFQKLTKDTLALYGTMVLDKESLAYASFELNRNSMSSHPQIKQRINTVNVAYEEIDGKWYLKYYSTKNEDIRRLDEKRIYGSIEFITTDIKSDSVRPIPYERQLQFFDPLITRAEEYNKKGWTDYSILDGEDESRSKFQFTIDESTEIFKEDSQAKSIRAMKVISVLTKFHYDIGISYRQASTDAVHHDISFQPNGYSFAIKHNQKATNDNILVQTVFGYKLNKNINVFYQENTDLFNKSISINERYLGIGYSKNVKPTGLPLFLETSLMFSSNSYFSDLGEYDNPMTFQINGKKIDSKVVSFDYGYKYKSITSQISISKRISRLFSMSMYLLYDIHLHSDKIFRIKEEKGGLFSKKKIELKDNDVNLNFINGNSPWDSFDVGNAQFGVLLKFN